MPLLSAKATASLADLDSLVGIDTSASNGVRNFPATNLHAHFVPDVFNVKWSTFGAVGDGNADDTAEIQAAIDAAAAAGGGIVLIPLGIYRISSTLIISSSNIQLIGIGKRHLFSGGARSGSYLVWGGGASPMIRVTATSGASNIPIGNCQVSGLTLDCQHLATYGLQVLSCRESKFDNIQFLYPATYGLHVSTVATLSVATDSQEDIFESILCYVDSTAGGIDLGSDHVGGGNTSFNTFRSLRISHLDGIGINLVDTDGNDFYGVKINRRTSGTGIGVKLNASSEANLGHARHNSFYYLEPGAGGLTSANGTQPAVKNSVYGYTTNNSSALPTVEPGSTLFTALTDGRVFQDGKVLVSPIETGYQRVEDFDGGGSNGGQIGVTGWALPTGTWSQINSVASHPGIGRLTATAGVYGVSHMKASGNVGLFLPSEFFDITFILLPTQTDSNTVMRFGVGNDASANAPGDGIWIEKLGPDTAWFGATRTASGTASRTAALLTVDTNWLKARIRRIDASTVGFTLNALTEVTLALTIPTAAVLPFLAIGATSVSKTIDIDLFSISIYGISR